MKRCVIGAVLLGALVILGMLTALWAERTLSPMEAALEQAAEASFEGNWAETTALTDGAGAAWQNCRYAAGILFSQASVEEIDGLFARIRLWQREQDRTACACDCLMLRGRLRALADSQSLGLLHFL